MFTNVEWQCETWYFKQVKEYTYALRNLYTSKSFQPREEPSKEGSSLIQQNANVNEPLQHWEFVKSNDDNYKIRLYGTDLYLSSTEIKKKILLFFWKQQAMQKSNFGGW